MTDCATRPDAQRSVAATPATSHLLPATSLRIGLLLLVGIVFLFLLLLRLLVRLLLQPIAFLAREGLAVREIARAIEVDVTFNERRLDSRVGRERMAVPDHEVGVLANVDGSEAMIEPELLRAVERAQL